MKGGYQIIDLRNLSLELSNSTGSITDVEILNQLRNLRAYIEKGHAFTKPLDNALKCVIVRYRDAKNGEKKEACQWANIETSNNSLTYEIKTKDIMIEVVFEEKTDEYENKYYDIKTAKYLYNHNEIVEGDLDVSGDISIGGDVEVDESSKVKVFENIVDKDGHNRFIEGDLVTEALGSVTFSYAKWALSGNHLILVLFGIAVANIAVSGKAATANIPKWIADKIVPLYSTLVDTKQITIFSDDDSSGTAITKLNKVDNRLEISFNSFTPSKDRIFRIVYDLLIDNE